MTNNLQENWKQLSKYVKEEYEKAFHAKERYLRSRMLGHALDERSRCEAFYEISVLIYGLENKMKMVPPTREDV